MRHARAAWVVGVAAAVALALVPTASEGNTDKNGLAAKVVATTKGPLTACTDANSCTTANIVWHFIYVSNRNALVSTHDGQFRARDALHNALVASSVEQHVFVDGVEFASGTLTPPPFPTPTNLPGYAARWPETVQCPSTGPPCNELRSPAVAPGENTAVLFVGWAHGSAEPNGQYVFEYTVHGTLNGTPVALTASSPSIVMTD